MTKHFLPDQGAHAAGDTEDGGNATTKADVR